MTNSTLAPFRFDKSTSSLYEYSIAHNAYLFCCKTFKASTLRGAINEYYYSQELKEQRQNDVW